MKKIRLSRADLDGYKLKESADGVELLINQTNSIEEFRFTDSHANSEFLNIKKMRELFLREIDIDNAFHLKLTYNEKLDSMDLMMIYKRRVKDDTREYGVRIEEMPIIYRFNVKDIEVRFTEIYRKMFGYDDEWYQFDKQEFYEEPVMLARRTVIGTTQEEQLWGGSKR